MHLHVRVRSLGQEEYTQLERMSDSQKSCTGYIKRVQILLLSNQGYLVQEIGEKLGIHERTARRWIRRFNRLGLSGLEEGARNGRPPVYSSKDVEVVLQTALTSPSEFGLPFSSWTLDRLVTYLTEVKGIAIKRSRLSELFRREGIQWPPREVGETVRQVSNSGPLRPSIQPPSTAVTKAIELCEHTSVGTHSCGET